jgi:hypothetical protein
MKQIKITVPDNCELKQDGNTYTIVKKEKKLTYDDVTNKLFNAKTVYWTTKYGAIEFGDNINDTYLLNPNNASTEKQLKKLFAINKLMNVAKYLNGDWQPDWDNFDDEKWAIKIEDDEIGVTSSDYQYGDIYFISKGRAEQAIEILGEETIKLALCTDY